jgi:dolichyl-phosphate beta-glucosyltransferase
MPAYNEEKRIGSSLAQIIAYLQRNGYSYELIVVDDGSTDRTTEIVEDDRILLKEVTVQR